MTENVTAEIISIGTEILLGEITDTNSVYIARSLRDIGVNVFFMTSVGDNENRITESIRNALARAQIVITTGGLGPTIDDMTRQAVAEATGRGLTFHQDLLDKIAERFVGFRSTMTDNNRRQAYLPDDSIVIENPVGTAPSFIVEHEGGMVISLPGVPREMKFLMAERVIPHLRQRYQLGVIKARILRTAGIGESSLDDLIGEKLLQASNPTVGLAAHSGMVDVRITTKADSTEDADRMIAIVEDQLRTILKSYIFGTEKDTIESTLINTLHAGGLTLAVTQTGIGDAISRRLERIPNHENVLVMKQTYANPSELQTELNQTGELALLDLAKLAAEAVCKQSNATVAIAVVSNPDQVGDHADSDVGTAVAVFMDGQSNSRVYGFGGQDDMASAWTSTWAMARVWQMLQVKDNVS